MQNYRQKDNNLIREVSLIFLTAVVMFAVFFAYVQEVLSVPNNVVIQTSTVEVDGTSVTDEDLTDVIARIKDSVVEINTTYDAGSGAGSGVIFAHDDTYSYIVTNHHVIEESNTITVILTNGTEYAASLVGSDPMGDIAVIKIVELNTTVATLGHSSQLELGETAIVIGNPLGLLGGTVTSGIISSLDREIDVDGVVMTLLQTNAEINSGNSGGGLFNAQGLLMGIVNAKSFGTGIEGIGFAIPIDTVSEIITQLVDTSTSTTLGYVVGRVSLGVEYLEINSDNFAQYVDGIHRMGVWVNAFYDSSDAEDAGVEVGDKIYSIDGTTTTTIEQVNSIINSHTVGDTIVVGVVRNGLILGFNITLTQYIYSL